jgi:futalosine hydrolase
MLLVVVATEKELRLVRQFVETADHLEFLVLGMGPVSAAASLSSYLALNGSRLSGVINIGIGGAYADSDVNLLDLCLAKQEVFGDFGVCMQDEILDFEPDLTKHGLPLSLKNTLSEEVGRIMRGHDIEYTTVNFVTVNCCTGTRERGEYLRKKFDAGCENMEGGAVAMVCKTYNIPCAELRCISNLVEDRNIAAWKLDEAIQKMCRTAELVLRKYPPGRPIP